MAFGLAYRSEILFISDRLISDLRCSIESFKDGQSVQLTQTWVCLTVILHAHTPHQAGLRPPDYAKIHIHHTTLGWKVLINIHKRTFGFGVGVKLNRSGR